MKNKKTLTVREQLAALRAQRGGRGKRMEGRGSKIVGSHHQSSIRNPRLLLAMFEEAGVPGPVFEYRFDAKRRWRFDIAWPSAGGASDEGRVTGDELGKDSGNSKRLITPHLSLALEVQGGIWTGGRHTRGAALLGEWEKLNAAACAGWRVLFVQPRDLMKRSTVELVKRALGR